METAVDVTVRVRVATVADVPAIRAVADRTWRATYAGLLAEADIAAFLDWNYSDENIGRSIGRLGEGYLVAVVGDEVVGYAMAGTNREGEAELFAIYVTPEAQGQGIGYALWRRATDHLRAGGAERFVLWVAAGNERARHFYERQGAVPVAERVDQIGERSLAEVRYQVVLRPAGPGTD